MDNVTDQKGFLGEVKVIAYFVERGYDIFTSLSGKSAFDIIAYKDSKLIRVSIKATTSIDKSSPCKSYRVQLGQHVHTTKKPFDNTSCDVLAVYIIPEDRIVLIESNTIKAKYQINIKPDNAVVV